MNNMDNENEHDFTKLMLEAIRAKSSNHINFLNEDAGADGGDASGGGFDSNMSQAPTSGDNIESNIDAEEEEVDTDVENEEEDAEAADNGLDSPEAKEEISKMNTTVSPLVTVTNFKIYEDTGNVVMSGELQNTEMEWQFSKNEGFFINAANVNLTEELKGIVDKLNSYYTNWKLDWAKKIGEYTKND